MNYRLKNFEEIEVLDTKNHVLTASIDNSGTILAAGISGTAVACENNEWRVVNSGFGTTSVITTFYSQEDQLFLLGGSTGKIACGKRISNLTPIKSPFGKSFVMAATKGAEWVVAGSNGKVFKSNDLSLWQRVSFGIDDVDLTIKGIVYHNKKYFFVTSCGRIIITQDFIEKKILTTRYHFKDVVASSQGVFAVSSEGYVVDLVTQRSKKITEKSLHCIGTDGTNLLMGSESGILYHMNSQKIIKQIKLNHLQINSDIHAIQYCRSTREWCAFGSNGTLLRSKNLKTWNINLNIFPGNDVRRIITTSDGKLYMGRNSGEVFVSQDGLTWQFVETGLGVDCNVLSMCEMDNEIWAAGVHSRAAKFDGMSWRRHNPDWDSPRNLQTIFSDGTNIIAVGDGPNISAKRQNSPWSSRLSAPYLAKLFDIKKWNDLYIGVGTNGITIYSSDLVLWELGNTGYTKDLYRVEVYRDFIYAVGEGGSVVRSKDGQDWEHLQTLPTTYIYELKANNDCLLALTEQGEIWISVSGDLFEPLRDFKANFTLRAASYHPAGFWMVGGQDGKLLKIKLEKDI